MRWFDADLTTKYWSIRYLLFERLFIYSFFFHCFRLTVCLHFVFVSRYISITCNYHCSISMKLVLKSIWIWILVFDRGTVSETDVSCLFGFATTGEYVSEPLCLCLLLFKHILSGRLHSIFIIKKKKRLKSICKVFFLILLNFEFLFTIFDSISLSLSLVYAKQFWKC